VTFKDNLGQPDKGCFELTIFIFAVFEVLFGVLNTKFKLISFNIDSVLSTVNQPNQFLNLSVDEFLVCAQSWTISIKVLM
jgi:hypothetical protein